jgi:hypothetical protein
MMLISFLTYAVYHDWEVLRETSLTHGKGLRQERDYLIKRIVIKFHDVGSIHLEESAESDSTYHERKAIQSLLETFVPAEEEETYPTRPDVQAANMFHD